MKRPKRMFPRSLRLSCKERRKLERKRDKHWYGLTKHGVDPETGRVVTYRISPYDGKVLAYLSDNKDLSVPASYYTGEIGGQP